MIRTDKIRDHFIGNMRKQGYSLRIIAQTFNISHEKVRTILTKIMPQGKIKKANSRKGKNN